MSVTTKMKLNVNNVNNDNSSLQKFNQKLVSLFTTTKFCFKSVSQHLEYFSHCFPEQSCSICLHGQILVICKIPILLPFLLCHICFVIPRHHQFDFQTKKYKYLEFFFLDRYFNHISFEYYF